MQLLFSHATPLGEIDDDVLMWNFSDHGTRRSCRDSGHSCDKDQVKMFLRSLFDTSSLVADGLCVCVWCVWRGAVDCTGQPLTHSVSLFNPL